VTVATEFCVLTEMIWSRANLGQSLSAAGL